MSGQSNDRFWKTKVLSWIHDPAEKALILLRGKPHERGTAEKLRKLLFGGDVAKLPAPLNEVIRRADRWASAADRPSLPRNLGVQVVFAKDPQLIHPLTGEGIRLPDLTDDPHACVEAIEAVSFDHFQNLVVRNGGHVDWRRTFLSFWRFGPESPAKDLGALWRLLPADTRSPDHSIWEHLRLTSAFAGCFAAGKGGPALLTVSLGPVQGFIAQARSMSDLWAGSHLLSFLAWQALRVVCARYGPDAVLFPDLHGVPLVDAWITEQVGGWPDTMPRPEWATEGDDRNPLLVAALPNRFVALVPAEEAEHVAREVARSVRHWVRGEAERALDHLLKRAGQGGASGREVAVSQIQDQLDGFPEVYWAVVPWRLAGEGTLDDRELGALRQRLGLGARYLDADVDALVRKEIVIEVEDGSGKRPVEFFTPNPGVAYPGLHSALERLHAGAKAVRPFPGGVQEGWRCTLCGEREWLALDRDFLHMGKGERTETWWNALPQKRPYLAKEGEYLCSLCALKRAWPELFLAQAETWLSQVTGDGGSGELRRFNLSTRSVALATSIAHWLQNRQKRACADPKAACRAKEAEQWLANEIKKSRDLARAALPYRVAGWLRGEREKDPHHCPEPDFFKALPVLQDAEGDEDAGTQRAAQIARKLHTFLGTRPETYYALVLMDGDRMGAWLSGEEGRVLLKERFHHKIRDALEKLPALQAYLAAPRPGSPARHQAISSALNGFALGLARYVVEHLFMGKLIYAGGDDLLAMVSVHDLPGLMLALRCTYSGVLPCAYDGRDGPERFWEDIGSDPNVRLLLKNGFALLPHEVKGSNGASRTLLRLMGPLATASVGAVVAHHQAPLARVLRDLRAAERLAKEAGGRNAFCITVDKRAGGTTQFVGKWGMGSLPPTNGGDDHMLLLLKLRGLFASGMSRRAAYALCERLRDVPPDVDALAAVLAYQFERQGAGERRDLARRLAKAATAAPAPKGGRGAWPAANAWLRDLLVTAEFLAREGRAVGGGDK